MYNRVEVRRQNPVARAEQCYFPDLTNNRKFTK